MFKKLRNKFIITNAVIPSIILICALSAVFFSTTIVSERRRPDITIQGRPDISQEIHDVVNLQIQGEREQSRASLIVTLLLVGIVAEVLVVVASYYIAEKSIRPVKDAYKKQQEFIANASHELKTPIAAAQANFEALGTSEQPWTDNVNRELDRATDLIKNMLTLAHAENATALPEPKDTNLVKLLRDRIAVVKPRLANKTLVVNFPKKLSAAVNERAFTEIADILLDNAIKYSDQQIEITLSEQTLVIQNDGAGIPQDKLAHIFDRFYQVDKTAEGAGLGLSIAKSLAEQNHWRLTATSEDNQTEFSLKF